MAVCRGCGAETNRTRTTYGPKMVVLKEVCNHCEDLGPNPQGPTEKLWLAADARPQDYKTYKVNGEDVLFAKDELRHDTETAWGTTDVDRWKEKRRRTVRREPMTPAEIAVAENWGREVLRPTLDKMRLNEQYRHID